MKILDKYLLKTFLLTFTTVFVILFFIFILQTVWLFIAELAGKDLDLILVVKFLLFSMPRIIPLVLPLSVLLASIMTFGNLAENYEFAAMKASGISLQRAMRGLVVFICFLSIVAFLFANNVIPYAEYKFINFRKSIAQAKPAMAIAEGQFSDVGFYNIKVNKKSGTNGNKLTGVTIHEKANNSGENKTVIKSKTGELISNEKSSILQLVLNDGYYYQDVTPKKYEDRSKMPFIKGAFKKQIINIDLSQLNKVDDSQDVSNTNGMLNASELRYTLDSLNKNLNNEILSFSENINQKVGIAKGIPMAKLDKKKKPLPNDLLSLYTDDKKAEVLKTASSNLTSAIYSIDATKNELKEKQRNINRHLTALYEKFVIAFACFLMFFIGAPLGAIIRKGGLGLPIVFAVLIFITFHFINTFGKRISQEDGLTPFMGAWMSTFILTPLAVMLTYRATNDNGLINFDAITTPILAFFTKYDKKSFEFKKDIVSLDSVVIDEKDTDYLEYGKQSDSVLKGIVKNAEQFGYTTEQRLMILKILEDRGITQDDLLISEELYNAEYFKIKYYRELYKKESSYALVSYFATIVFSSLIVFSPVIFIILNLFSLVLLYAFIYKSSHSLVEIDEITERRSFANTAFTIILGFPLFMFIYLYNLGQIKDALAEFDK